MDEKGKMNTEEYEELIKEVEANSPYKRLSSAKKKWMSVSEMGELLGFKKTDRYWLVHKNFFETKEIVGKMRVNIEKYYQRLLKAPAVVNPIIGKRKNEYVSTSTIRDIHKFFRSCFKQAVKWELMEKNPCIYATVPKHKTKKREI